MMNQAEMKDQINKDTANTQAADSCCGNKLGKTIENLASVKEEGQQDKAQPSQSLLLSSGANLTKKPANTEDCCAPKKACCKLK